jgi:hypothetical protein
VKVWIGFLLISFIIGGRSVRTGKPDRPLIMLAVCFVVAAAFYSYRWA